MSRTIRARYVVRVFGTSGMELESQRVSDRRAATEVTRQYRGKFRKGCVVTVTRIATGEVLWSRKIHSPLFGERKTFVKV